MLERYGERFFYTIRVCQYIGINLCKLGRYNEGLPYLEGACERYEALFGKENKETISAQKWVDGCRNALNASNNVLH